jgi:hypothetical protein
MHRIVAGIALAFAMASAAADEPPAPKGLLRQLRFSPDGKYVLAQDDSEITILTVQPLSILFRIPAERAEVAQFTPDSGQVVFLRSALRVDCQEIVYAGSASHVERWDIANQTRLESTTLPTLVCGTKELSPDGRVLACVDPESTLRLVAVASGQTTFEKTRFARLFSNDDPDTGLPRSYWGELGLAHIDFSPDGRFVVVTSEGAQGPALAVNVREQRSVGLIGVLKQLRNNWSAWIAPDRILVLQESTSKRYLTRDRKRGVGHARVVAFPSGKVPSEPKVPYGNFCRAADPGFVIFRSFGGGTKVTRSGDGFLMEQVSSNRAAAAQLNTELVIISNTPALDVLGRFYVAESAEREVGLYEMGKGLQATVVLHKK